MSADEKSSKGVKSSLKDLSSAGNPQNTLCKYIHRHCFQERIQGYDFCIRHILEDKNAPFRQCTYIQQPHKKRCTNAAPKTDKNDKRLEALCPFHVKQSLLKIKPPPHKRKAVRGPKALLRSLEHYCKNPRHDPDYYRETGIAEQHESALLDTHCPASLKSSGEIDANERGSSDKISGHVDTFEDHQNWELSSRDLLRHAGVYTGKEVIALARDKAIRLKTLYIEELKRTYYRLKELRREYLREVKTETKKSSSKLPYAKSKMLKYLEAYHSPIGIDKVMRRKNEENRMGIAPKQPLCTFIEDGRKCTETAIVCTKYCIKHILSDPNQCLFVPCSATSKKKCDVPVLPITGDLSVCKLHLYTTLLPESKEGQGMSSSESTAEQENFQSVDELAASLGFADIAPGSLFGLDQEAECVNSFFRNPSWIKFDSNFGEPSESTDTVMSEEQADLMEIQPITLNLPADILSDSRKSDYEEEK